MSTYYLIEKDSRKKGMYINNEQVYRLNGEEIKQVLTRPRIDGEWRKPHLPVVYPKDVLENYGYRELSEEEVAMLMFEATS